jgi:phenylpyruvate tautomerase PptA (4-oxalocrotonate tautomerase family)
MKQVNGWGNASATDKQKAIIAKRCADVDVEALTKKDASMILNGLKAHNWRWRG